MPYTHGNDGYLLRLTYWSYAHCSNFKFSTHFTHIHGSVLWQHCDKFYIFCFVKWGWHVFMLWIQWRRVTTTVAYCNVEHRLKLLLPAWLDTKCKYSSVTDKFYSIFLHQCRCPLVAVSTCVIPWCLSVCPGCRWQISINSCQYRIPHYQQSTSAVSTHSRQCLLRSEAWGSTDLLWNLQLGLLLASGAHIMTYA